MTTRRQQQPGGPHPTDLSPQLLLRSRIGWFFPHTTLRHSPLCHHNLGVP
ncbi:hypothetical protein ACG7TL_001323 [Trametes sanguinea]